MSRFIEVTYSPDEKICINTANITSFVDKYYDAKGGSSSIHKTIIYMHGIRLNVMESYEQVRNMIMK